MPDMPQDNLNPEQLDEELVAYLDGELEPAAARRLEDRLAADSRSQQRLSQLAASWDMLDQLPRATVDDGFSRTTVEMVALSAEDEIASAQSTAPSRARNHWLIGVLAVLVGLGLGFAAMAVGLPDRNDALLRDLSVVQNFDVYRQIGDIDFARRLNTERLFGDNGPEQPGRDLPDESSDEKIPASIAERQSWVETLDAAKKSELRRSFDKFSALSAAEQQSLRTLDQQLRADPLAAELQQAIERYHDWLKNRSPTDRAELAEQPDNESKIIMISRLRREQAVARFSGGWPMMRDADNPVGRWLSGFARKHQRELVGLLTPEHREDFQKLDERRQGGRLMFIAWEKWWQPRAENVPPLTDEDLQSIQQHLPPDVQRKLREASTMGDKITVFRDWLRADYRSRFPGFGGGGRGGVNPERLSWFFQTQLSSEDRARLLGMQEDEKNRELRRLYDQWRRSNDGPRGGRRPGSFDQFPRDGRDRPGPERGPGSKGGDDSPRGPQRFRDQGAPGEPRESPPTPAPDSSSPMPSPEPTK